MSVSGVSFSNYYASNNQNVQSKSSQIQQEFQQLGQQISSGNSSAAQSDYSNIQNVQSSAQKTHFHHHYHVGSGDSGSGSIEQLFQQLGQSLQSGNTTTAQQAFTTLQQDLQQAGVASGLSVTA
jgi:hypothetical protein